MSFQKNVKSCFFKSEKNEKYVFSNTEVDDPVTRRARWSRASASRLYFVLMQRNWDGFCSVSSQHTYSNVAVHTDVATEYDGTTESGNNEVSLYFSGPVGLHCLISYPVDASRYLGTWLDLTTSHRQTWLFSSTSTYHSTDLLTARGVAHLVVHGTNGSTSYERIPPVRLESSGGVLSTVDMVVQRRDGPRWLLELDDDDDVHTGFRKPELSRFVSCAVSTP